MRRRPVLLICLGVLTTGVFALATATWMLFLSPGDDRPPGQVDALVVLAGSGPRLPTGESLAARGVAPLLIVSDGGEANWPAVEAACAGGRPYTVTCITPDPANTRGEAAAVAAIVADRDLDSLGLVTSRHHMTRAALLVERCTGLQVQRVPVSDDLTARSTARLVVREWGGLLDALLVDRGC